ncbi:hypothetical protein AKUA2001_04470 [Apilactobacillus kunkeei]|nr:hypothetical protein AKUA1802_04450 [Apilactobacillus kunkeei]CAI2578890.1 hypothetical protein AKUA0901_04450 [Apilactobacillus kunkeei]CAI2579003.1 hypothetical protein AKUA1201_04450 [Apilactobacillus kunkeei]CAI2579440.1 hypothetical protein AKUA1002_04450 [Apilactobacillus kunkeei]CAI2644269.1 hypothetical protein AKUA1803_04450 [Apilactobacillus kunkeei]
MGRVITVLERHKNLIKVKFRGEFGYFFPDTNLVNQSGKVETFIDAERALSDYLAKEDDQLIMVPRGFEVDDLLFVVQAISKEEIQLGNEGDLGIFEINHDGKIKRQAE